MSHKASLHLLVESLSEEEAARWVTAILSASRSPGEGYLARLDGESDVDFLDRIAPAGKGRGNGKPIWEVIDEIMADVPDEELRKIPPSDHIDHVLYGTPIPDSK